MTIRSEMQPRHGTACRFVHYYPLTSLPPFYMVKRVSYSMFCTGISCREGEDFSELSVLLLPMKACHHRGGGFTLKF